MTNDLYFNHRVNGAYSTDFMRISNLTNLFILRLYFTSIGFLKDKNFINFSKNNFEPNFLIFQFSTLYKIILMYINFIKKKQNITNAVIYRVYLKIVCIKIPRSRIN